MEKMDAVGIISGFCAAFFQSLSYVGSRWFLKRAGGSPLQLLGISHIWMGLAALLLFPLLASPTMPPLKAYWLPGIGAVVFYMIAQAGLFLALRHTDSSRISPLLGLKVFVLALISVAALNKVLNGWQWGAVALCVGAVFILNESGGRLPWAAMLAVWLTVIGYSLSDLCIKFLVVALQPAGARAALIGVCVTYMMGAVAGVPLVLSQPAGGSRLWGMAAPYAACWFISMLFLYITFDRVGVVFGNIIQSTRGLMSIGLGVMVVRLGMLDLERSVARHVVARRLGGAVLMTAAIVLYMLA
jgi:drug/metabolite transporter (DMT)-like permease